MEINELARRAGLSSKTIRYSEGVGVTPVAARSSGGFREWHDIDVERLNFIRRYRELRIPLGSLKKWVKMRTNPTFRVTILNKSFRINSVQYENGNKNWRSLSRHCPNSPVAVAVSEWLTVKSCVGSQNNPERT